MNKQKQIEELKKILCTPCAELVEEHDKIKNLPAIYAEAIYNAGYRKADEVRKETAKEILKRGKYCMPSGLRDWIKERYGVEVENDG